MPADRRDRVCAIVDAYSSGRLLPGLLAGYGVACVHVQSSPAIPDVYRASFDPAGFLANVVHAADAAATAAQLAAYRPVQIMVGAESGVPLFDQLAVHLGLPGNGPSLSAARRDKFEMQERLRLSGLRSIPQLRSADAGEVLAWAAQLGRWPVVLKPLNSAGSDGVTFCETPERLAAVFGELIGTTNRLGFRNAAMLAQAYVGGQEYVVNSVSWDGAPCFSEIWQINKRLMPGGNLVYDHGILLPAEGEVQRCLTGYVAEVLSALGLRYGAAHAELMLTAEGPVLIEIGARLAGSISHRTTSRALGYSHASLLAEAYFDQARFGARLGRPYERRAAARFVSLISHQAGTVRGLRHLEDVRQLASFSEAVNCPGVGHPLRPTVDLFSSPGLIYLCHPDEAVVEADQRRIRDWEAEGFFDLAA